MDKASLQMLLDLLEQLQMNEAPCKGRGCVGHLNCDFCENGCYGESCAIEDVQSEAARIMCSKKR